jgi:predicted ATPase
MNAKIWISEIEFNDTTKIQFSKNDITVFVGPNNAGKSASLKESAKLLRNMSDKGVVIKNISIEKEGEESDFISFLESVSRKIMQGNLEPHYQGFGYNIYVPSIRNYWANFKKGLSELFPIFVNALSTEARLGAASPAHNIKLTIEAPSHPIHFLQKHDELEKKFSDYFRQAFGTDLIVHRNAGNEVPLYIGEKPIPKQGADRVSESYLQDLEKLDLLHLQGDGMRSFVGVILNAFISSHSILFIDEPEAFLHPPQARLLGKMIAKDLPSERQLFLATHSEDFLKGLLDANNANLKIIRIQREGLLNKVSVLHNTDINNIWNDSLLRHSSVLNGLFHSKVIICESDSDCRFYSAILSATYDDTGSISPDIMFIHCGGKHRMPTVVKSLVKLNVVVRVVADFDVLNDVNPLKEIYEELGGTWSDIEYDWKITKTSIDQKRPELETIDLKREISAILDSITDKIIPKEKVLEINKTLKKASAWAHAKEVGKAFIPSGDATNAYERAQINLREKGLYVVEVGQLESFCKSIGNHGPKWVNEVMTKNFKTDPELDIARQFVRHVVG